MTMQATVCEHATGQGRGDGTDAAAGPLWRPFVDLSTRTFGRVYEDGHVEPAELGRAELVPGDPPAVRLYLPTDDGAEFSPLLYEFPADEEQVIRGTMRAFERVPVGPLDLAELPRVSWRGGWPV